MLCLLAALVGLGPRRIELDTNSGLRMLANGAHLPEDCVANPLGSMFGGHGGNAAREWAIGINAFLGIAGASVKVHSSDGVRSQQALYQGDQVRCSADAEAGPQAVEIVLDRPGAAKTSWSLETKAVQAAFGYCPVELWLNGRCLSDGLIQAPEAACLWLRSSRAQAGCAMRAEQTARVYEHAGPIQALVAFSQDYPQDSCHWLYLGRSFEQPVPWRLPNSALKVQLWIACDRVEKDLSQSQLVANERYARVMAFVESSVASALEQLVVEVVSGALPPRQRERLHPLLAYCVEALASRGEWQRALDLQKVLAQGGEELDLFRLRLLQERLLGHPAGYARCEASQEFAVCWAVARANLAIRGPAHPKTQETLLACAQQAFQSGDHEVAIRCWTSCPAPLSPEATLCLGQCLMGLGRIQQARDVYRSGLETDRPPELLEGLATAESLLGNLQEAARLLAELLRIQQAQLGNESKLLGPTIQKLALLCRQLQQQKTAAHYEAWLRRLA